MEKLADGLQKLGEEDLLQVVQMVYDNKTQDTYTKNDVESKPSPSLHISISPYPCWMSLVLFATSAPYWLFPMSQFYEFSLDST